ncbi:MAG TPA: glycosyl hydrolase, partial [Chryseolinea sp.]|nr:glycosyl hydrolase [Chryseolinea sp.]
MKRILYYFSLISGLLIGGNIESLAQAKSATQQKDTLAANFINPPQKYGIRCWWWWLNGNVTKESISRDLEEMKAKGFSGACLFDAGGQNQQGNGDVPEGPMFGSPEWRALFVHAVNEANRLGLVLSLSIQSGWN